MATGLGGPRRPPAGGGECRGPGESEASDLDFDFDTQDGLGRPRSAGGSGSVHLPRASSRLSGVMALPVVQDASARPAGPTQQSSRRQGQQLLSAQRLLSAAAKAAPQTRLKTASRPPPAVLSPPSADDVAALRAELASIGQELARITPTLPSSLSPLFVLNWPRLPHAEMLAL